MKTILQKKFPLALLCTTAVAIVVLAALVGQVKSQDQAASTDRTKLQKQFDSGNFKTAYEGFSKLALSTDDNPLKVGGDLTTAITALQQLGRIDEVDGLRDSVLKVHTSNWRLLMAAADSLLNGEHYGFIIAGKFSRGPHRGGGQTVSTLERDRVQALKLMVQAIPLTEAEAKKADVADFWMNMAQMLLANRGYNDAWRLQTLTKLDELPDYDYQFGNTGIQGAPVDAEGNPVFHKLPKSWQAAQTDGQRWRWSLAQTAEYNPQRLNDTRFELAQFLENQFGDQTMAYYGPIFNGSDGSAGGTDKKDDVAGGKGESGPWAVHSLGEDETIARLANGIKRFKFPDDYNFIHIYQQIADEPKTGRGDESLQQLARIFENRRQFHRAAEFWKRSIKEYGAGQGNFKQQQLNQIVDNWCRFEPVMSQGAGKGATVDFRYRNGSKVNFEAHEIDVNKLLADVKAYLKSNPRQLDWQKLNIGDIGYRLVQEKQSKYLGAVAAQWQLALEPLPDHFDKQITVTTPLQKAGAYLLTAKMENGNTSNIILWVEDTAIVKKPLENGAYCYVGDAVTGAPIAKAHIDLFAYRQRSTGPNRFTIDTQESSDTTDDDGQVIVAPKANDNQNAYQWLITATTPGGRLAYLGFTGVWASGSNESPYDQVKVFTITDRPVYRPGQKVNFKLWVRRARYDQDDKSEFANQTFRVEIQNPKGEKVLQKTFTADAFGGLEGEFALPADATLGMYQLYVVNRGGGNFRVEEYKKPEYEVTVDAPTEPVMLGDKITATIKAKYYFGSPVTDAKVKYKVTRSSYSSEWFPLARWDWLYGPGYWWFAYDRPWYPGWRDWGFRGPQRIWWPIFRGQAPPEVLQEREVPISADGTVNVEIDTALAKLIHGDQDHQYTITAEVVDQSRRTVVGQGNVLAARKPFRVYAWVDRGYYRVGDLIRAEFQTQTLDSKPVTGTGVVKLYQITYKDDKPVETLVRSWPQLNPDDQGHSELQIQASAVGQYRLSYQVTDGKQHTIEGAYLFTINGAGNDGRDFRFNDLELIPERREYNPNETVDLMINTNRTNGTVLLFARPMNGVYQKPKVLRLSGKSAVEEIAVVQKDMPNFFVEAVTIADGKLFTEAKEIAVPPEKRVLNVSVSPSSSTYKPGQNATVDIKVTDSAGKPFVGSTVLAIYDKAVEYIAGRNHMEDIKAFFWKWQRYHSPNNETNLMRAFANLAAPNQTVMENLGIFGNIVPGLGDGIAINGIAATDGAADTGFARSPGRGGALRGQAMPMAAAPMAAEGMAFRAAKGDMLALAQEPSAALVEPTVRTNFADTALWRGSLTTDENGLAQVALTMPENLTTWKVRAWSMGNGTRVGQDDAEVVTRKNLIVRLQAPRFFTETDEVVLSANVHNYLKSPKNVTVSLELDGKCLAPLGELTKQVEIPNGSEVRVDWRVKTVQEGQAIIRMKALSDEESDATQQQFPVYVHGMLKTDSFSGALRPDDTVGKITLRVPAERRVEQSRLEVRYSPTLAGAMVDALPYLVDYPYGCTEQTLNRFLPTVITQHVLIDMGLDLKKIQDKRTNLNAQQIGTDKDRAKQWKTYDRNPVFDQAEVGRMVKDGVNRLAEMQLTDGGWGWFSGWGEQSYPHTTATVVHGLQIARNNDVALPTGVLERGVDWLKNYQARQIRMLKNGEHQPKPENPYKTAADNVDALVYMVLADASIADDEMREFLYRDRTQLAVYSKSMFALALQKQKRTEQLQMLLENLKQYVVEDEENQTAYLKLPENNYWWCWYGSDTEANAYYLKLLTKTDPKGRLASRLVKYLLNNRQHGTYWKSTRDTSLAIEALADYLKASGEDKPELTVEVWLDGQKQKEVKITAADLFTFDNQFVLEGAAVTSGEHKLELRKSGSGPLYYNAYLTNFTLEDPITAAGLEVKVERKFYKLKPVDKSVDVAGSRGQVVGQKVEKYERLPLENLSTLTSGDLVEVELEIDSKNDYEYVLFEDRKAAGFEPVELRSGYNGNSLGAYMELHDNRVSFFVRQMARGKHSVSYRLRAEVPGQFSALPAVASAMYAPELKGNSNELKLKIAD